MFSHFAKEKIYTDRVNNFYFDKDNGAIITTSFSSENKFFKQLQHNIEIALKPLIELVAKESEEELQKYSSTGRMFSRLPQNHPASILLNLKCILEENNKFFGIYKKPLSKNAITDNKSLDSLSIYSEALANLTNTDNKEAYKLLLKLNACREQCYFVDSMALPVCEQFFITNKTSEVLYKSGVEEIISFADFQKKIEKSIAYLLLKTNQHENTHCY
jgi:hypothetical protein